jgi:hypothetical protein
MIDRGVRQSFIQEGSPGQPTFDAVWGTISGDWQQDVAARRLWSCALDVRGLAPTAKQCRRYAAEGRRGAELLPAQSPDS